MHKYDFEHFYKYLSTRYCIVEREKVMEEYKWHTENHWSEYSSDEDILESFHNIFGTSMFNQNEE